MAASQQRRSLRPPLLALLIITTVCVSSGCSRAHSGPDASSGSLFTQIERQLQTAELAPPLYRTAREAMPTTSFVVGGKPSFVSDLFIDGTVVSVDRGVSYAWPGGPSTVGQASTMKTLPFNASGAEISNIYVSVSVAHAVARDSDLAALKTVRLGLSLPSPVDLAAAQRDLAPGTRVAAILVNHDASTFPEAADVFGVLGFGEFLGTVDPQGLVTFPVWARDEYSTQQTAQAIPIQELMSPVTSPVTVAPGT